MPACPETAPSGVFQEVSGSAALDPGARTRAPSGGSRGSAIGVGRARVGEGNRTLTTSLEDCSPGFGAFSAVSVCFRGSP
jgi:hypothetical protein